MKTYNKATDNGIIKSYENEPHDISNKQPDNIEDVVFKKKIRKSGNLTS